MISDVQAVRLRMILGDEGELVDVRGGTHRAHRPIASGGEPEPGCRASRLVPVRAVLAAVVHVPAQAQVEDAGVPVVFSRKRFSGLRSRWMKPLLVDVGEAVGHVPDDAWKMVRSAVTRGGLGQEQGALPTRSTP